MNTANTPHTICADRLRILLHAHRYAFQAVRSSAFGGWFIPRNAH